MIKLLSILQDPGLILINLCITEKKSQEFLVLSFAKQRFGTYKSFFSNHPRRFREEKQISEVNVSLGGLFLILILLASQAHEEITNKDGLHISCFSGTGERLPTYLF